MQIIIWFQKEGICTFIFVSWFPELRKTYLMFFSISVGSTSLVGWSYIDLFAILKTSTKLPFRYIFYESNSNKSASLAARGPLGKVFIFTKIVGTFKINIISENTFLVLRKTIANKKIQNKKCLPFLGPQNGQIGF